MVRVEDLDRSRVRPGVEEAQLVPFSAETGEGRDELAEAVLSLVAGWQPTGGAEPVIGDA